MREARIILPVNDNDGESLAKVHEALQETLCEYFGGYTRTDGVGGWKNNTGEIVRDRIAIYNVAIDDAGLCGGSRLLIIAAGLLQAANQDAIYYRGPDGIVEILAK